MVTSEVRAEPLAMPKEYGATAGLLPWPDVRARLETAPHYWLMTVRPDGRPHAVPVDGLWIDDQLSFGGSSATVRHRNLLANPAVLVHLPSTDEPVIVEGTCRVRQPTQEQADGLVQASQQKYGYAPPVSAYLSGVWTLTPAKVMAWGETLRSPTVFRFTPG